jgi:alpha-D-ribose 1-methylphosphonate 5-triphosphate synthase subunit PhnH
MTIAASDRLSPLASQAVFRVLLGSLARPGRVLRLPAQPAGHGLAEGRIQGVPIAPGAGPGVVPLALATIDSKVAIVGSASWQSRVCEATGALTADITDASLVAIYEPVQAAVISQLRRGSAAEPEAGAKVGLGCRALVEGGTAGLTLELAGPGVPGRVRLGVDGVDAAVFDELRSVNAAFPAGIDVWLVDDQGQVAGMPRSTLQVVV